MIRDVPVSAAGLALAALVALAASPAPVQARPEAPAVRATEAVPFAPRASYRLCFVPDGDPCDALLAEAIGAARRVVRVQAYLFTSAPLAQALRRAHERGVEVRVILDQSQVSDRYSVATYLRHAGIPVAIDRKPAIAHNKVMIFDDRAVFTGSYNFTKSAATRNAENGILIQDDPALARAYVENWTTRLQASEPY